VVPQNYTHEKRIEFPVHRFDGAGTLTEPLSGSDVTLLLFPEFSKRLLFDPAGPKKIFRYPGMQGGVGFSELAVTVSRVYALFGKLLEYERFFSGHIFSFLSTFHHLDFGFPAGYA
jgi:hypothetical protein